MERNTGQTGPESLGSGPVAPGWLGTSLRSGNKLLSCTEIPIRCWAGPEVQEENLLPNLYDGQQGIWVSGGMKRLAPVLKAMCSALCPSLRPSAGYLYFSLSSDS